MKKKCVLNKKYGGFQLSVEAVEHMLGRNPDALYEVFSECSKPTPDTLDPSRYVVVEEYPIPLGINKRYPHEVVLPHEGKTYQFSAADAEARFHPALVCAVEELGGKASAEHSKLQVEEITINFSIDSCDGLEKKMQVSAHNSV
jgi:hypothetical protein